jgi:F0F1-type ATP synthase assembly protein I
VARAVLIDPDLTVAKLISSAVTGAVIGWLVAAVRNRLVSHR